MIVKKLDYLKYRERGKELKVPHHTSTAAVNDSNLPQIMAFIPNTGNSSFVVAIYIQLTQLM